LCPGSTCAVEGEPLLNGRYPVPDSYITASSQIHVSAAAPYARLDGANRHWCPSFAEINTIPPVFYLQVGHAYTMQDS